MEFGSSCTGVPAKAAALLTPQLLTMLMLPPAAVAAAQEAAWGCLEPWCPLTSTAAPHRASLQNRFDPGHKPNQLYLGIVNREPWSLRVFFLNGLQLIYISYAKISQFNAILGFRTQSYFMLCTQMAVTQLHYCSSWHLHTACDPLPHAVCVHKHPHDQ